MTRLKEVESTLQQIAPKTLKPASHTPSGKEEEGEPSSSEEEDSMAEDTERVKGAKKCSNIPSGKANSLSHQEYVDVLACMANNLPRMVKVNPNTDHGWSYARKAGHMPGRLVMAMVTSSWHSPQGKAKQ